MKKTLIFVGTIIVIVIVGITLYFTIGPSEERKINHTLLLKRNNGTIIQFDIGLKTEIETLVEESSNLISSFTPYLNKTIYYATKKPHSPIISSSEEYKNSIFRTQEWTKTAMAVDYVTEKLYVLDELNGKIYVVDIKTNYYTTILSELNNPKNMVLDLTKGVILILQSDAILLCYMDGLSLERLVDRHPQSPDLVTFTIDQETSTVYYADSKQIHAHRYGTERHQEIASLDIPNVKSLAFTNNNLYYISGSNPSNTVLMSCRLDKNKSGSTCYNFDKIIVDPTLEEVQMLDINPPKVNSFCNNNNGRCDQICLHSGHAESCACTDGWHNNSNYCFQKDYLYVKTGDTSIHIFNLYLNKLTELMTNSKWGITSFDIYSKNYVFYTTTKYQEPILCSSNDITLPKVTANWYSSGLTNDFASSNVYVVDELHGQVNVARIGYEYALTLLSGLDKPKNIILDADSSLMFIQQASSVLQTNMDGTMVQRIFNGPEITSIAVDRRNKIVYIATSNVIVGVHYLTNERFKVIKLSNATIISLAVVSSDLYAIISEDFVDRSIQYCPLSNGKIPCQFKSLYKDNSLTEIKSYFNMDEISSCKENNGECQHICLTNIDRKHHTCVCAYNYELNPDGKTCKLKSV